MPNDIWKTMLGVRAGSDDGTCAIGTTNGRLVVNMVTQCGHDACYVDVLDLLAWIRLHRPELLKEENQP